MILGVDDGTFWFVAVLCGSALIGWLFRLVFGKGICSVCKKKTEVDECGECGKKYCKKCSPLKACKKCGYDFCCPHECDNDEEEEENSGDFGEDYEEDVDLLNKLTEKELLMVNILAAHGNWDIDKNGIEIIIDKREKVN